MKEDGDLNNKSPNLLFEVGQKTDKNKQITKRIKEDGDLNNKPRNLSLEVGQKTYPNKNKSQRG